MLRFRFCRSRMGNCFSSFRAKFRPNGERGIRLSTLPKPPHLSEVADYIDGVETVPLEILNISSVDLCLRENGLSHHTSQYDLMSRKEMPCLVVRRGQAFFLEIAINRRYNPETDGISFIFTVSDAEKPSHGHGTLAAVGLLEKDAEESNTHWSVCLEDSTPEILRVRVMSPVHCTVARWSIDIDTKLQNNGAISYSIPVGIYVLYNPWCLQDQVYLESEEQRQEYVMETSGLIWRGTAKRLRPVPWMFSQFDRDILDCCLYVALVVGKCTGNARGDPVRLCRALSAAVNSPDDNGVVYGNWSDDFGSHTPPTKWAGSKDILQKFWKSKKPVKYGQCWVFSGVLTTICRALGIPSRVVTNYSSAHDTQNSLTVDYFVDENGEKMEEMNEDSIWNFHVWNEVWMDRPDLGVEYGGWQAIDATPQELSDDMFRCGPAPVSAVKRGEILKPYDCAFLFSEVNADKVFWKYSGLTQPLKLLRKDMFGIGHFISTKAVGRMEREDITSMYKYPEQTIEERQTMLKALRQSEHMFSRYYLNEDFNEIKFDFQLRDDIKIGQPFHAVITMKNRSRTKDYKVNIILRVETALYTGKIKELVKRDEVEKTIKPGEIDEFRLEVTYDDYYKKLCDQCSFNISCLATVLDTKFEYYAQDDFRVRKPDIKIKLHNPEPEELKECTADILLENPLPIPLRKGQFVLEGPGILDQMKIYLKEPVPVGGFARAKIVFTPPMTGRYTLIAKFTSKEMDDVDGFVRFMVLPNKEMNENGNLTQ